MTVPIDILRQFAEPRTIADIGAADGHDSLCYAQAFPASHVFAFEPLKENFDLMCSKIQAANLTRQVYPYQLALSNKFGEVEFHRSTGRPPYVPIDSPSLDTNGDWRFSSSLLKPADHLKYHPWCSFKPEKVKTTTFDSWAHETSNYEIDFVHMDVQGAELLVLEGARGVRKSFKSVWLEVSNVRMYEDQPLASDVSRFFKKEGFRLVYDTAGAAPQGDQLWIR